MTRRMRALRAAGEPLVPRLEIFDLEMPCENPRRYVMSRASNPMQNHRPLKPAAFRGVPLFNALASLFAVIFAVRGADPGAVK